MASGSAIRGSRVGAGPMGEAERGESAPRFWVSYWCANGHETRPSFSEEAGVDSLAALVDEGVQPFDLVFIDADKPSNTAYLQAGLRLSHPGTVIVVDNVVRQGAVADADSTDERILGSRAVIEAVAADPRLTATVVQTVGSKGYDGFLLIRRQA